MAIGLRLELIGGTEEQYDTLHSNMGIDDDPPEIKEFPVHHFAKP
jgi:hypothetical protein